MPDPIKPAAAAAPAAAVDDKKDEKKQDFEGAFSEFAKAKTTPDSAPASTVSAATPAADAGPANGGSTEPKPGESSNAKPAQPAPGAAAVSATPAAEDPWKDAPQALREAHERAIAAEKKRADDAEQARKSAEGRYKASNSKLLDMERRGITAAPAASSAAAPAAAAAAPAAAAAAKPAQPAPGDGGSKPAATPAAAAGPQMPPEWQQLVETLPDVAKAVEARFGAVDKAVKDAMAAVKPVQEAEVLRFKREQGTLLGEAYPGWLEEVAKPEFNTWLEKQPASVRALADSDYAADNAALLEYYGYQPQKQTPNPEPAKPAPGGKSAAEIQAERDARLQRSESVRGSGAAPLADAPDNFEQAFTFYARKRAEAQARTA